MKFIYTFALFTIISVSGASCQDRSSFKVTLSVMDERGTPVEGANISTDIFDAWRSGESFGKDVYKKYNVITNASGIADFEASTSRCEMVFRARKEGFYWAGAEFRSVTRVANHWQPWNPTLELVMWRVRNPIPLMAKKVIRGVVHPVQLPAFGKPVGYDFERGDWVKPHGKGITSDILLQLDGQTDDASQAYDATFRVAFSNPSDGIILHPSNQASELKLPYLAPEKGYETELVKHQSRTKAPTTGFDRRDKVTNSYSPEENYFLRLRTVVDESGKIVSANYAKIYRGFEWFPTGSVRFQYHFNPKPNDLNLEFDPSKNLLNLPQDQRVTEP